MPVIIKDYEWRQTDDCVIIRVNVNVTPINVDLLVVDNYLKAHFKPFILELFLWGSVKDDESTCTISDKELNFTLKKVKSEVEWPKLETDDLTKEMKRERRNSAFELAQVLNQERVKSKKERRHYLRKQATQAQIDLNTERLNRIDNIRDSCRKQAMYELDEWSKNYAKPCLENEIKIVQENRMDSKGKLKLAIQNKSTEETSTEKENNSQSDVNRDFIKLNDDIKININKKISYEDSSSIWDGFDSESDEEDESKVYRPGEKTVREIITGKRLNIKKTIDNSGQSIPLPRKQGKIHFTFSERVFVTPARESFKEKEEEWLTKQAKARRASGFVAEDLRPEEQDPQWCLDKGEDFMKVGNYLAAISAFSHGIKLNDKIESLYIMRSTAHYACKNYQRCIEDTSKALELMVPECEGNRESRARCYARRGAALCQLSALQHGLPELEAALKLLPNDEQILTDIHQVKRHFKLNNSDANT